MSDRTKTPPETPSAKLQRPSTDHEFIHPSVDTFIDIQPDPDVPGRFNIGLSDPPAAVVQYVHTIKIDDAKLPADWYDGNPKRCPGSGEFPRAMRTGEDQDHGQGYEHVYLSRCLWCNKPLPPSERAAEHTFIPVRAEDVTFKTGQYMYGIEPTGVAVGFEPKPEGFTAIEKCDGDHPMPACADPGCWHAPPPIGGAEVLVRFIGPHAELLCDCCELPLNAEPVTLVEITDDDSAADSDDDAVFHVWHLSCARKEAAKQGAASADP